MSTIPGDRDYATYQASQLYTKFYCGATNIPEDVLATVLRRMGDKWKHLDPIKVATPLYNAEIITYDEHYHLCNRAIPPGERINNLVVGVLPRKAGDQRNLMVTFHHCLQETGYRDLAREAQQRALVECGIDAPILAPEHVCGVNSATTLEGMVEKLKGKQVSLELANEFKVSLGLDDNDVPANQTDLCIISKQWILKKTAACSPEALVEALVLTPGLGKFASGIGCPNNPHEACQWFLALREKWISVAAYLGYTRDDLEVVESEMDKNPAAQIRKFLNMFQMPDCGVKTMSILRKLGDLSDVSEVRKKPANFPMNPDLCGIDQTMKKLNPAKHYCILAPGPGMAAWLPVPSGEKVALTQYAAPYGNTMPAVAHMRVAIVAQPGWDVDESMGYAAEMGSPYAYDPQFLAAQEASIESYNAETAYQRPREQQNVGGEATDMVTSDPSTLTQGTTSTTPDDQTPPEAAPLQLQPESFSGDRGATECSVTTSEEQETAHELRGNGACAPVEIIRVTEDHDVIRNCKDPHSVAVVESLLNTGASLHIKAERDGFHPIHLAVLSGSLEMVKLVIRKAPELINSVTDEHRTPLMIACLKKYAACVKLLVENDADIAAKDCNGFSCLHFQQTLECPRTVSFLIEKDPTQVDIPTEGDYLTPLARACLIGQLTYQSAEYLLSRNANPNGSDQGHIKPLSAAAGLGCEQLIEILLANGAQVNSRDKDGTTPLLRACKHKQIEAAVKLIGSHASLNEVDEDGESCVFAAVSRNCKELLEILIACGADVNMCKFIPVQEDPREGGYQVTPLALASAKGYLGIVEALVEAKANVNYTSELTVPAIVFAVVGDQAGVVEYFLKLNEISKTLDGLGSAIETAMKRRNQPILKILLDALGGYEKVVHRAREGGHDRFAELLSEVYEKSTGAAVGGAAVGGAEAGGDRDTAQLTRRKVLRSAENTLEEFVHINVCLIEQKKGKQYLIDEADRRGYHDVAQFYQRYLEDSKSIADVMQEFIRGRPSPADFIFNDPHFSGFSLRDVLQEIGKLELIENTMLALMHYPGAQILLAIHDGADLLKVLFGDRFYHEIKSAGLLDPTVIRPQLPTQPSEPLQPSEAITEPQFPDTRSGASPSTVSPTADKQKFSPQQGQTGGRKLSGQLRETAEARSMKPPQDDLHTGHSSYREQTASINGVPLDPHSKTLPTENRFHERDASRVNSGSATRSPSLRRGSPAGNPVSSRRPPTPNRDGQHLSTDSHSGKPRRKLPQTPPAEAHRHHGPQPQTLGHSEYPPRTRNAQLKPALAPARLPTSTSRDSELPPAVSTPAPPSHPSSSLPHDEVRATSRQRMKAPNSAAMLTPTRVSTQRSVSWSSNSCSSLDSTAPDDDGAVNPCGANKPRLHRQDTGYASNADELRVPETQDIPRALYKPLDLRQKCTVDLLKKLAVLIPNWQQLAHQLGLDDQEIEALETNFVMWQEQCFQMLKTWIEKDGNGTYAKLVEELRTMQRQDLESLIHQHIEQPTTGTITQTDDVDQWVVKLKTLDNCIERIHITIRALLEKKFESATIRVSYEK